MVGLYEPQRANFAVPNGFWGDPAASDFETNYLSPITLPTGKTLQVHRESAKDFEGFFNELSRMGYPLKDVGGYNFRNKRGGSGLSQHAYGNAVDVNASTNPFMPSLKTDLPPNISEIATKYNLAWGGDWQGKKDPMHFEWRGPQNDARAPNGEQPAMAFNGIYDNNEPSPLDPPMLAALQGGVPQQQQQQQTNLMSFPGSGQPASPWGNIGSTMQNVGAALMSIYNPAGASVLAKLGMGNDKSSSAYEYKALGNGRIARIHKATGKIEIIGDPNGDRKTSLNPVWGEGPNGETVIGQLSDNGQLVPTKMPEGFKPKAGVTKLDLGTHFAVQDNKTGTIVQVIPKNNFGEAADKAKGTAVGSHEGTTPARFRKASNALGSTQSKFDLMSENIDTAITQIDGGAGPGGILPTAGWGAMLSGVPNTSAKDLSETLRTLKSNISFRTLQDLREASPTGGALGNVSNYEVEALQSVLGSVLQDQSPDQLKTNLLRLKEMLKQSRARVEEAFQQDFGNVSVKPTNPAAAPAAADPFGLR